jgi:hypothetical protein
MTKTILSSLLVASGVFLMDASAPTSGVQVARAQTTKNVRVRVDFRTLYCKAKTGDEIAGHDEPYVKYIKVVPGKAPVLGSIGKRSVKAGQYVWDGDSRQILLEENLAPGEAAAVMVFVMEDDGKSPNWQQWIGSTASCGLSIYDAVSTGGAAAASVLSCVGLGGNLIRVANGDDEIGQFTITVKNDNGVVKKTLHTSGKRSQVGGYSDPALSESGKTIRMRLGQGTDNPQKYQASLQVRQITDIVTDEGGDALTWTVTGRDDAK